MKAKVEQINELAPMLKILWSEHPLEDLKRILKNYLLDEESDAFTELIDGHCVGLALVCLRHDYVEGCMTRPVGYLEGIYVEAKYRDKGIAKKLCQECELWAKAMGCTEFASDCEISNELSYRFHLSAGFNEENRIIHFKKEL